MSVQVATTTDYRAAAMKLAPLAIPSIVFLLHAALFTHWIVDDAGISFAYARNLATGHGLVSQPGLPPVEGYSNPLWVFLTALLYRLHLFTIPATPKLVSWFLVLISFAILGRLAARPWAAAVALTLLALNTSFVAWTTSGLENPLYVFLLCLLAYWSREFVTAAQFRPWRAARLGLLATAIAMTRPEGALYLAAFPTILLVSRAYRQCRGAAPLRALLVYGAVFAVGFGAFLWFRWSYFGDLLPNTYYAKGSAFLPPRLHLLEPPLSLPPLSPRLLDVVYGAGGWGAVLAAAWTVLATGYLLQARRFGVERAVVGLMMAFALSDYLLLPQDWMEEYRFATPFYTFFTLYTVLVTADFLDAVRKEEKTRIGVAIALAALALVGSGYVFAGRSARFVREPTVDFDGVREWISQRFDWYAETLGVQNGSVLVPDLGATLYYSHLRVYDLAMLCDKTIARTLNRDEAAFHDYLFAVAKPTFLHTHGSWSYYAALDDDPRFRRDYTPIWEHVEPWRPKGWRGRRPMSGDYVRKEAVRGREATLEQLRQHSWW